MGLPKGDPVAYLTAILRPGDVCIDGGANIGHVTEAMAKCVGDTGSVLAVEPDPRCHDALAAIEARYPQVMVIEAALTATRMTTQLHQGESSPQSSRIKATVTRPLEGAEPLPVVGYPLDSLVEGPVRAVKLDLQGGEEDALHGAWSLLRRCEHWIVEIWPWGLREADSDASDIVAEFARSGLHPHWMTSPLQRCGLGELEAWAAAQEAPHQHVNAVFTR